MPVCVAGGVPAAVGAAGWHGRGRLLLGGDLEGEGVVGELLAAVGEHVGGELVEAVFEIEEAVGVVVGDEGEEAAAVLGDEGDDAVL